MIRGVCGAVNVDGARSCTVCGAALGVMPDGLQTDGGRAAKGVTGVPTLGPAGAGVELGAGGMGTVYRVRDGKLRDRERALKVLHPHLARDDRAFGGPPGTTGQGVDRRVGTGLDRLAA